MFATVLALLSMIPLDFIAVAWIFRPEAANCPSSRVQAAGRAAASSPTSGYGWLSAYLAYSFLLTWNVIAMEAAPATSASARTPTGTPRSR